MRITIAARGLAAVAATLALAAALAACSTGPAAPSAAASAAAPSSAAGGANAVTIKDLAFAPGSITVSVGSTVTWTNQDTTGHTVTADDGSFDSKTIAGGASFSQMFATAGTYAYHCNIHSSMTATVVVK